MKRINLKKCAVLGQQPWECVRERPLDEEP